MNNELLKLIPHREKMVLIDKIINLTESDFQAQVTITSNSLLVTEKGVPAYCAIEYMAQSIAAFNNLHFSTKEIPDLGFIIAIRSFKSSMKYFEIGSQLDIFVDPILIVKSSGSFKCIIKINNVEVTSARITAYVPSSEELAQLKSESYE
jgi:predicted hotdog family 3-hydroxylacyl-ACP dehydratase